MRWVVSLEADANFVSLSHGLFHDLRDGAGADGVAAFANREAQALLQGNRRDQRYFRQLTLSPGITISTPAGSFMSPVTSVVRK